MPVMRGPPPQGMMAPPLPRPPPPPPMMLAPPMAGPPQHSMGRMGPPMEPMNSMPPVSTYEFEGPGRSRVSAGSNQTVLSPDLWISWVTFPIFSL